MLISALRWGRGGALTQEDREPSGVLTFSGLRSDLQV